MPLSDEQIAALAGEEGVDVAELRAALKEVQDEDEDADSSGASKADTKEGRALHPNGVEVNAYHFQAMRVNEIRRLYGYDSAPDGELFFDAWLKKQGGGNEPVPAAGTPLQKPTNQGG